jgi:hypothetical protein
VQAGNALATAGGGRGKGSRGHGSFRSGQDNQEPVCYNSGIKIGAPGERITMEANLISSWIPSLDCLHDMGDPVGAVSHALQSLESDGTAMIVEPFANDKIEDNLNPLGRMFYAASTMACVPGSMAFNGPALGAQAGEPKIAETVKVGGFNHFRRATQTPFNIIYEAKP